MRVIREIKLDSRAIVVKELTVEEIRAWLFSKVSPGDLVDSMLFDEFALSDLEVLTDLTAAEINALAPSEIEKVLPVVKEVNARFFVMRERTATIGRQILAAQPKSESAT